MSDAPAWQGELYDLLKNEFDVTQFSYVPDAGHRELINRSIADAARLHQQHAARAAEMCPALQRDALFLRRDRDGMDVRVGNRTVDQLAVPRIGDI